MPAYYDESTKTWFCKFYYTDYTGAKKQKKKRGFKLQREAKEWERAFLERLQGTPNMTFQALYDLYIEDKSHRIRQSTLDNTKCVFNTHILPYFKNKPINSITPTDNMWATSEYTLRSKCFFIRACAAGKCWHSRWLILTSKQIPSMSAKHCTGTTQARQRQITATGLSLCRPPSWQK